jgi:hypothetical protein
MNEAYAVRRTVPPSAEIEAQIDALLAVGWARQSGSWAIFWSAWTSRVGLEEPGLVGKHDCLDPVAGVELFDGAAIATRVVALGGRFRRPPS